MNEKIQERIEELERLRQTQVNYLAQLQQAVQETSRQILLIEGMIAENQRWLEEGGAAA